MKIFSGSPVVRWIALALVAAALLSGGYLIGRSSGVAAASGTSTGSASQPSGSAAGVRGERPTTGPLGEQARREAGDPFAVGSIDAPVVMVVFSDYRCPFCARYSTVTEPELMERFVDSGKLRIEWRDFPVFGEASLLAARAGRAAAAQGRFWEFNGAVYEAAPQNGHHDLTVSKLRDFAVQAGVPDLERFDHEMTSDAFDGELALDTVQARNLGITGTPSFIIDGNPVVGAQPTPVFVNVIEQALAAKN